MKKLLFILFIFLTLSGFSQRITRMGVVASSVQRTTYPFIFTILTLTPGQNYTLPLNSAGTYNMLVNWGDGDSNTITAWNVNTTHSYDVANPYTITIKGLCTQFTCSADPTMAAKVKRVINFADLGFNTLTFTYCTNLDSIASNMNILTHLSNVSYMFYGCTSLRVIPARSFDGSIGMTNFVNTFYDCTSLIIVPSLLFTNNIHAVAFNNTFYDCPKLTIPADLFCTVGDTMRFNNQSVDFTNCFSRASFTGVQGTAPELWTQHWGTGTPITTGCFGGLGNSILSLTNYASIPSGYK